MKSPSDRNVITEERRRGFMSRLSALVFPKRMWKFHQIWLEELRENAKRGMPPAA